LDVKKVEKLHPNAPDGTKNHRLDPVVAKKNTFITYNSCL
jgi:hypothetical protein